MFDQVPVTVWLTIAIAALAFAPARYVYSHIAHAPSRRDITLPPEDLSWRTPRQLARSLSILVALFALAVFIFTPTAAQFARSPIFWPLVVGAAGAWSLSTVPLGFTSGRVEPFIRGVDTSFERQAQPGRFWGSLIWNGLFGCGCIWLGFQTYEEISAEALQDQCSNQESAFSRQEALSACNKLISKRKGARSAEDFAARASAYYNQGDYRASIADYSRAIRLSTTESYVYYNRGLAYEQLGDAGRAASDFGAAIRLEPNDPDAYFRRGLILLEAGRFDDAAADLTRATEFGAKGPWALANRGLAYAWKDDRDRAEADFTSVRTIDPSNPVMLRGEAVLRKNAGDIRGAVDRLTASMVRDPRNAWALRTRAELYWELGEVEKSREDDRKWLELNDAARSGRN